MNKRYQDLTSKQLTLPLKIEKEMEIDGIGMGVLSDGTPYLTGRGIARMCGVDQKAIVDITQGWNTEKTRPREAKIKDILRQQKAEAELEVPYIPIRVSNVVHHAFPDVVCMAILEYYSFDSASSNETAIKNYRLLARRSFKDFIYTQVGYDPANSVPRVWQQFHDRVSLIHDTVPDGYFSIFREIANIIVTIIKGGGAVGADFVPDISVGIHWAKHWRESGFDEVYGPRKQFEHNYPAYFPQAASNPQTPYCYPDVALGEFRSWIREMYIPKKIPDYIATKVSDGTMLPAAAKKTLAALSPASLPSQSRSSQIKRVSKF